MASKYLQKFPVPDNFYEILHDFAREVIRDQPDDILEYGANYFDAMLQGKIYVYEGKFNIKRSEQKSSKEYQPENQRKKGQETKEMKVMKATKEGTTPQGIKENQDFKKTPEPEKPVPTSTTKRPVSHSHVTSKTTEVPLQRSGSHNQKRTSGGAESTNLRQDTATSHGTEKAAAKDYVANLVSRSLQSDKLNNINDGSKEMIDRNENDDERLDTNEQEEKYEQGNQEFDVGNVLAGSVEKEEKIYGEVDDSFKKKEKTPKQQQGKPSEKVKEKEDFGGLFGDNDEPISKVEKRQSKENKVFESSKEKNELLESSKEQNELFESSKEQNELFESSKEKNELFESSKEKNEQFESKEEKEKRLPTEDNLENFVKGEDIQEQADILSGEFYVQVINASNLPAEELHTETFCVVFFSNNPTKIMKTGNSDNARNPEWKHLDKFVLQIEKTEIYDIQLVFQVFNFENGKTLVGENLLDPIDIFEKPGETKHITLKLKNSEGEEGSYGEISLLLVWVPIGEKVPDLNEYFYYF